MLAAHAAGCAWSRPNRRWIPRSQPMQYMPVRSSDVATSRPLAGPLPLEQRGDDPGHHRHAGDVVADAAAHAPAAGGRAARARRPSRSGPRTRRCRSPAGCGRALRARTPSRRRRPGAGARSSRAPWSRPRRSSASGRRLVMNTSAVASSACIASPPSSVAQVEHDRCACPGCRGRTAAPRRRVDAERVEDPPQRVARGRLDLDHVGAPVGQDAARRRPGDPDASSTTR